MLLAQVRDALDVALGRVVHAARADHRLAEERRDAVGADALDLRLQRGQRVVRDRGDARDQRAPVARVGLDAADARAEAVRAVVALRAADEVHALGMALLDQVAAGDLGRRVDRVAAAGGRGRSARRPSARATASRSESSFAGRLPKSPKVE